VSISPFGEYLREVRTAAGKSLRDIADALGITHVYVGEVERGRRRTLPEKYWPALVTCLPSVSIEKLKRIAAISEPLDPAAMDGPGREVVVALARALEEGDMSDDVANQLLQILQNRQSGE